MLVDKQWFVSLLKARCMPLLKAPFVSRLKQNKIANVSAT